MFADKENNISHDVFISYSAKDKSIADALCHTLESAGIRCWIAPRDVLPGFPYAEELVKAISVCRVMVLIFSSYANKSPQVMREVERAVSKGKVIDPFRIEDVEPSPSMEYFISSQHWLDALTPPLQDHFNRLAETLLSLLSQESTFIQPNVQNVKMQSYVNQNVNESNDQVSTTDTGDVNFNEPLSKIFRFRIIAGPHLGEVHVISNTRFVVGRSKSCDIAISKEKRSSRHHFALNWEARSRSFVLIDFGAANPVLVNDEIVAGDQIIKVGDVIQIGETKMVLEINKKDSFIKRLLSFTKWR